MEEIYNIYGLKYSILRYGTLYGERSDKNNGLHQIIKTAILKKKIVETQCFFSQFILYHFLYVLDF